MTDVTFQYPNAFYLLWLVAGVWAVTLAGWRLRERGVRGFFRGRLARVGETAGGSIWAVWARPVLMSLAVVALVTALARPVWGYRTERQERLATDVVICVDTSKSMLAADAPGGRSRLDFAKLKVDMLLSGLEGERVALAAFAGEGVMACPFTYDSGAPKDLLAAISSGVIPLGGTSIAGAIKKAVEMFERNPGGAKALLLVTDGEDHAPEVLTEALKTASDKGVRVFILGVGTAEGAAIKVAGSQEGTWEYVKDASGAVVQTRLNEELLLRLAKETGGVYSRASAGNEDIRALLDGILALNPGSGAEVVMKAPVERYVYPAAGALILLWLLLVLPAPKTREEAA